MWATSYETSNTHFLINILRKCLDVPYECLEEPRRSHARNCLTPGKRRPGYLACVKQQLGDGEDDGRTKPISALATADRPSWVRLVVPFVCAMQYKYDDHDGVCICVYPIYLRGWQRSWAGQVSITHHAGFYHASRKPPLPPSFNGSGTSERFSWILQDIKNRRLIYLIDIEIHFRWRLEFPFKSIGSFGPHKISLFVLRKGDNTLVQMTQSVTQCWQ